MLLGESFINGDYYCYYYKNYYYYCQLRQLLLAQLLCSGKALHHLLYIISQRRSRNENYKIRMIEPLLQPPLEELSHLPPLGTSYDTHSLFRPSLQGMLQL